MSDESQTTIQPVPFRQTFDCTIVTPYLPNGLRGKITQRRKMAKGYRRHLRRAKALNHAR